MTDRNSEFAGLVAELARGLADAAVRLSRTVDVDEVRKMKQSLEALTAASAVYIRENTAAGH